MSPIRSLLVVRYVSFLLTVWLLSAPVRAHDWIYIASDGDTLWDICLEYTAKRGCAKALADHNNRSDYSESLPVGTEIRVPYDWLLELPIVGSVISVQGEVSYQDYFGSKPMPLSAGQDLVLGSVLRSHSGSARISLGDYSELLLRPNSILELSSLSSGDKPGQVGELVLDRGDVEVQVRPESRSRFEIYTPSAIAAVRGTQYRLASDVSGTSTRGEVLKGRIAMQTVSTTEVPAGFGLLARQGAEVGELHRLLPAPVFPAVDPNNLSLPVAVGWTGDSQANHWLVDIVSAEGDLLVHERTNDTQITFDALPGGCHRMVVRGVDAEGFRGLDGETPLCVDAEKPRWAEWLWSLAAALILL